MIKGSGSAGASPSSCLQCARTCDAVYSSNPPFFDSLAQTAQGHNSIEERSADKPLDAPVRQAQGPERSRGTRGLEPVYGELVEPVETAATLRQLHEPDSDACARARSWTKFVRRWNSVPFFGEQRQYRIRPVEWPTTRWPRPSIAHDGAQRVNLNQFHVRTPAIRLGAPDLADRFR